MFVNPFSPEFLETWKLWKQYKAEQFHFTYKGFISEQAAINGLADLSEGNEETAKKIIMQSMANGWMGLFTLKTLKIAKNGKSAATDPAKARESINDALNKRYEQRQ